MRELDFTDAPHLERLRKRLWSGQAFGNAAVMVGAGFSRNAERLNSSTPPPPDFNELAKMMWSELNSAPPNEAPQGLNPLDVAADYEAMFHREALDALIKRSVPDLAHLPARMHRLLMSLPWADVFTTNWDTLLERAATDVVDRQFRVVETKEAVVGSQRPRIVKLHGSFPNHAPYVVTKEDFRCYPRTHAPFVNTVQQAVMECALCLVGFSGSDPNFLAWTGWVNDHLGEHAPPIYLTGVLDLNAQKRSVLQHRGVFPIDLGDVFPKSAWPNGGDRHRAANEWFLLNLAQGEVDPLAWPVLTRRVASGGWKREGEMPELLTRDSASESAESAEALLKTFPGWLVCPDSKRALFEMEFQRLSSSGTTSWRTAYKFLDLLCAEPRNRDLEGIRETLDADPSKGDEWFELGLAYVGMLRRRRTWSLHKEWLGQLAQHRNGLLRRAALQREEALAALAVLDLTRIQAAIASWPVVPNDHRMELCRAALLVEIGEVKEATAIVERTLKLIRAASAHLDQPIALMALEGTAMTFLRSAGIEADKPRPYGRSQELSRFDCSADEYFEAADHRFRRLLNRHESISKGFDAGTFHRRVHLNMSIQPTAIDGARAALRLFEAFALPFRYADSTFNKKLVAECALSIATSSPAEAVGILVRAQDSSTVDKLVTALFVARLSEEQIVEIDDMCSSYIASKRQLRHRRWEHDLSIAYEVRSRLMSRVPQLRITQCLNDVLAMAEQPENTGDTRISRAMLNCIRRGYLCSDASGQCSLLPRLLRLPLPDRLSFAHRANAWCDPIAELEIPQHPSSPELRRAVAEVQVWASSPSTTEERWQALARLLAVHLSQNLTADESRQLGTLVWSEPIEDVERWLQTMEFSSSVLLRIPGAALDDLKRTRRAQVLAAPAPAPSTPVSQGLAIEHCHAIRTVLSATEPLRHDEAVTLLERTAEWLVHWRSNAFRLQSDLVLELVRLLLFHLLPSVTPSEGEMVGRLVECIRSEPRSAELSFQLQRLGVDARDVCIARLLTGLRSDKDEEVWASVGGIANWLEGEVATPTVLVHALIQQLRRPGLRSFAQSANRIALLVSRPERIRGHIEHVLSALTALLVDTDVTNTSNDQLYGDSAWMPDARIAASELAAEVWKQFPEHRPALEPWRLAASRDPILESRKCWSALQEPQEKPAS